MGSIIGILAALALYGFRKYQHAAGTGEAVAMLQSMRGAAIVHAVVALARALGMKVTAEGVENADQQLLLRVAG